MECYCYLRNVKDLLADGKTRYERRFGEPFKGPVIPFGAMVENHPLSAKDLSRLLQFYLEFTFGYALYAGGIWKGDILVADVEELEILEVSEIHARRLHAKEIITPKRVYNSYSQSQMEKLSCLEKIKFSEDPSEFRTTLHETKSTKTFFKESRTGLNR